MLKLKKYLLKKIFTKFTKSESSKEKNSNLDLVESTPKQDQPTPSLKQG